MEESDSMLVSSLRDFFPLPEHLTTLKDIRAEEIFLISLRLLEHLKVDTSEVKSLSGKAQRFRSMAKLNQSLFQELQTQFELNELMNPSVPFLRKFLLLIINKLGTTDGQDKSRGGTGTEERDKPREERKALKAWVAQEWLHPSLAVRRQKYQGYVLPMTINKNFLKNNVNLTAQLNNPMLANNTQAVLSCTLAKHNQRVKEFEANEGISRKENEEAALRLNNIVKTNKDDWNINTNKLQKLKKKINEDAPDSAIAPPAQIVSVYKQELEQVEVEAEKKKQIDDFKPKEQLRGNEQHEDLSALNPFQLLKRQAESKKQRYQQQIRDILNELNQRKEAIQQWEREKEALEQRLVTDEEKATKIKQETVDLKKKVQKRQAILSTLQGQNDIEEEVKKLQGEITAIDNQVKNEVKSIEQEISSLQTEGKEKMEALNDLKGKLSRIQNDYERICEQITEKEQLKGTVKIMKSGISRLYYHKKINQMESRWRDTERETKKLRASLQELREKTRVASTLNLRVETEIENILNSDKSKNEPENKLLKQLMTKCKDTFQKTLKTLEDVNEVKLQTQDYEMKVHGLSGKNYKQNIEKIALAMEDLKREIAELSKSKLR